MPVPESVTTAGELAALLAMLTCAPVTAPGVVGAKVTVNVAVWPGVSVVLFATPLDVKPAPVVVTLEIVMLEFPLFVSVVVNELLLPSFTLPKDRLDGFALSERVGLDPVPERLIVSDDGVPFVFSVMLPVDGLPAVGVKIALKVVLPPAAIVVEVERPVWLNPAPETLTEVSCRVAFPLFFRVTVCELLLPTVTVPKLTLDGFAEICG